jgi:hypothetical protein
MRLTSSMFTHFQ